MDGYGLYIWFSFGSVFVTLIGLFLISRWQLKKTLAAQRQLQQSDHDT